MGIPVLIIGAGGVAHVAAHKIAQVGSGVFSSLHIASRKLEKCNEITESIQSKRYPNQIPMGTSRLDALNGKEVEECIRQTSSKIVINLGSAFVNMSVLDACIATGADYIDTAIHEDPEKICENPPWYGNYEWKKRDACQKAGVSAVLGAGFDPGLVNAYCKLAVSHFDKIDTIDILDVNVGSHGKFFATNFDPEINFREFTGRVWAWINRQWVSKPVHSEKMVFAFPVVGAQTVYLTGHDEIHSLSKNIDAESIRFWMGFSDHYINCFNILNTIGLLSEHPVKTAEGVEIVPLKVVKACLPDPKSLAKNYIGKTCIGSYIRGEKNGMDCSEFIYNICDHRRCFKEVGSQAISYTAGVPAVAAAALLANGTWSPETMVNIEELDPKPFINLCSTLGLKTIIESDFNRRRIVPSFRDYQVLS